MSWETPHCATSAMNKSVPRTCVDFTLRAVYSWPSEPCPLTANTFRSISAFLV